MRFKIGEVEVLFPYPRIYPEQYAYMVGLKKCLDSGRSGLLEMPSGTGKTASLLSLLVAYTQHHGGTRRIIYCSRTLEEVDKALGELKRLMRYRSEVLGHSENFLALGLSARKNMCVLDEVARLPTKAAVDAGCQARTAAFVRARAEAENRRDFEGCRFFEELETHGLIPRIPAGVYTIEDLREYCRVKGLCPYFAARRLLPHANALIYSYYYLLDPKVSRLVSRELSADSIVVFDEAHNIDNVCMEVMTVELTPASLEAATRSLNRLEERVGEIAQNRKDKLVMEYEKLVKGLRDAAPEDALVPNPIPPEEVLAEAIPGNIRRADHFLAFLRRLLEYFKRIIRTTHVITKSTVAFMTDLRLEAFVDRRPLRLCIERLERLVNTLEMTQVDELSAIARVALFASMLACEEQESFMVLFEPRDEVNDTACLQLACLDPTLVMRRIFDRFSSVIITSGTLSPLSIYPRILDFDPAIAISLPNTLPRESILPLVVSHGSDQTPLSSQFAIRNDPSVLRNYGHLLAEAAQMTPDGLVAFFPSYLYMHHIIKAWHEMDMLESIAGNKLLFIETVDQGQTNKILKAFRRACDIGRGAVLLSVARGKVSEGVDFENHYGRAVIMFGVPFQYTESRLLKARLEYARGKFGVSESDYLNFDAMRSAAQCIGRVLRTKQDYGLMILADRRYSSHGKRDKLPAWIAQRIKPGNVDLSVDVLGQIGRHWFREMGHEIGEGVIEQVTWGEQEILSKGDAWVEEVFSGSTLKRDDQLFSSSEIE